PLHEEARRALSRSLYNFYLRFLEGKKKRGERFRGIAGRRRIFLKTYPKPDGGLGLPAPRQVLRHNWPRRPRSSGSCLRHEAYLQANPAAGLFRDEANRHRYDPPMVRLRAFFDHIAGSAGLGKTLAK